jgi:MFS family permease
MANFERQYPMWAMAFGTLFATIPFVHLYSLFGARRVLFIAALLSTISTAFCPLAIFNGSFWALSSLRFIQVLPSKSTFPPFYSNSGNFLCR